MATRSRSISVRGLIALLGAAIVLVALPTIANAAAGDLDPSFSGDGIAYGAPRSATWHVAVDSKNRILTVAGTDVVTRFLPNGKLDKSFSGDGLARVPFDTDSIAVDPRDQVVVGGGAQVPGNTDHRHGFGGGFAVARLKANGKLDPSFSGNGMVVTQIGGPRSDGVNAVAVDQRGRIVTAGTSGAQHFASYEFAVARYLANGKPDNAFSGDGQTRTQFPNDVDTYTKGVALDSKGRIVVAGSAGGTVVLARYTPAGNLDRAFSQDGMLIADLPSYNGAETIAADDLDRIVVGADNENGFAILRYRPNGTLDPTFSGDGVAATTTFGYGFALNYGLAIDSQDRVVASGSAFEAPNDYQATAFALARLTPQGKLDPSFSQDGLVTTSIGRQARGRGLALDSRGRILVAGEGSKGPVVARYLGG
jgi:uncharacterized delta-60 repeat protein